jgi:hypothetical protein
MFAMRSQSHARARLSPEFTREVIDASTGVADDRGHA